MAGDLESFRLKFEKELKTGLLNFLILAAISSEEKPTYGYRIIRKLEASGGGKYSLPEGTVYPVLNSLSQKGFLRTYWGDSKSGPRRKYYEITPLGKKALENFKALGYLDSEEDNAKEKRGKTDAPSGEKE